MEPKWFHAHRRTERQEDMAKLIVALRNFWNARLKKIAFTHSQRRLFSYFCVVLNIIIIIIFVVIMFMKASFLFPDPQGEVGPSVSSSVVLCSIIHLVYIVVLVLVFYLCPSSLRVVATFSVTVLFPVLFFLCFVDRPS